MATSKIRDIIENVLGTGNVFCVEVSGDFVMHGKRTVMEEYVYVQAKDEADAEEKVTEATRSNKHWHNISCTAHEVVVPGYVLIAAPMKSKIVAAANGLYVQPSEGE